ncbi:hypothetical protein RHS04_00575 [Rhizoctonia solani]|uniref:Uncharacterized protein n=1 Tax=Rhizoctonia solani TaxID=456999 RepID=A0A8H7HGY5_9AGAM
MFSMSPREQHQIRQEREHLEAQKRKVERMEAHERRMKKQHEDAARAKADRARRHQMGAGDETTGFSAMFCVLLLPFMLYIAYRLLI